MTIASFLQHPFILFLGATALAAPLGAEEVAAELPDGIQNTFYCHKLKISSGPSGLHQLSYSAFKTANAFSMSSKLTVPPHMRWTYSGVSRRSPLSRNASRPQQTAANVRLILHSQCYSSYCDAFTAASGLSKSKTNQRKTVTVSSLSPKTS